MASKVAQAHENGNTITVEVHHLPTDSFSRSVDRAAFAYFRTVEAKLAHPILRGAGQIACTDARYAEWAIDGLDGSEVCVSNIVFTVR